MNAPNSGIAFEIAERFARRALSEVPSPVQRLGQLEAELGGGVEIYIKRDDLLRSLHGNKLRYIEYVLGAYREAGADCLIHCGGQASNYMAQLAMVGAAEGIPTYLVLLGERPAFPQGNALIADVFGAHVRYLPGSFGGSCSEHKNTLASELRATGRNPYVVDYPFSNHAGILGYIRAYLEIQEQIASGAVPPIDHIFLCSGGNSYLGMRIAADLCGDTVGITAFPPLYWEESGLGGIAPDLTTFLLKKVREFGGFAGCSLPTTVIDCDEQFVGEGYGIPTVGSMEAVRLLARLEGVLLDPIYSGKAMAGLLARLRAGNIAAGRRLLFVHTGGMINVFNHHTKLSGSR